MAEIQQEHFYAEYVQKLHWTVERTASVYVYIKSIPFTGAIAKIQRSDTLPPLSDLLPVLRKHNVKSVAIEPSPKVSQRVLLEYTKSLSVHIRINKSPFLPTKTIVVNLRPSEKEIFSNFSEAKRRAVRRAQKNNITVIESSDIQELISIKNKSAGLFGFITTYGLKELWSVTYPKYATILLARKNQKSVGGVLLLFQKNGAYYWIAGATREGKKLFTPTLLVWESLKVAKKHGSKEFDLIGAWDERLPKQNIEWKGFTKFKEGFGGKEIYYPTAMLRILDETHRNHNVCPESDANRSLIFLLPFFRHESWPLPVVP